MNGQETKECAEMAELSDQDRQEIKDFFAENKRLKEVCSRVEESFRAVVTEIWAQANKIDQLQSENEELKRENEQLKKTDADMTKPQPCTKYRDAERMAWIAKLVEETNEAIQEAYIISQHEQSNKEFPCEAMNEVIHDARVRLAMELTDVIHVCVSWLDAEGWDEEAPGRNMENDSARRTPFPCDASHQSLPSGRQERAAYHQREYAPDDGVLHHKE